GKTHRPASRDHSSTPFVQPEIPNGRSRIKPSDGETRTRQHLEIARSASPADLRSEHFPRVKALLDGYHLAQRDARSARSWSGSMRGYCQPTLRFPPGTVSFRSPLRRPIGPPHAAGTSLHRDADMCASKPRP